METMDSFDETQFIFDDYHHPDPEVFYTVTRLIESEVDYFAGGCNCLGSTCGAVGTDCECLRYGTNYSVVQEEEAEEEDTEELILAEDKFDRLPVFECNFLCSCFEAVKKSTGRSRKEMISDLRPICRNRNVQFGPIDRLEVFDSGRGKGFGLRAGRKIPRGSYVCEYAGEVILTEAEAKKRQKRAEGDMNFVLDLREHSGGDLLTRMWIDPSRIGNVGRYLNHSCEPNAKPVPVRVNDSLPWICFFAIRDIEPGEEICFDYGEKIEISNGFDSSAGGRKRCLCGEKNCRKYLPCQSDS